MTSCPPSRPQSSMDQTEAPLPQQHASAHSPQALPAAQIQPQPQPQVQTQQQPLPTSPAAIRSYIRRRYPLNITSDMHYFKSSNILHALLELPGVKKENVQIKMATCYFNHVKFISVRAESFPAFDIPVAIDSGTGTGGDAGAGETQTQDTSSGGGGAKPTSSSFNPDLRERRFGLLQRVIQVPPTTKVRVFSHFSNPPPPPSTLLAK